MSAHHQYVGVIYSGPNPVNGWDENAIAAYAECAHVLAKVPYSSIGVELDCDGENFASFEDKEKGWFFTVVSDDDRGMMELESIAFREGFHKDTCKLQVVRVGWRT